jgi:hypothetical protein
MIFAIIGIILNSVIWQDLRDTKGLVTHLPSGDAYGAVFGADSNNKIRLKGIGMAFGQPIFAYMRIFFRALIWIPRASWEGYHEGVQFWKGKRVECLRNKQLPPEQFELIFRIIQCTLRILFVDLVKIALIPIGSAYIALWGVISLLDPLQARRQIALTEEALSVDIGKLGSNYYLLRAINISAPCLQPRRVVDRRDLHRTFEDYSSETVRSRLLHIEHQLIQTKSYFEKETFQGLLVQMKKFRESAKKIALNFSDTREIEIMREDSATKKELAERREVLKKLSSCLDQYRSGLDVATKWPSSNPALAKILLYFGQIDLWLIPAPKPQFEKHNGPF